MKLQALIDELTLPKDQTEWSLLGANLATLVMALWLNWQLIDLMVVYWFQSVVIGASYVLRMLQLEKFSTENFTMNGRRVRPTTGAKWRVAGFFCVHFGFFHFVYAMFIFEGDIGGAAPNLSMGLGVACLAFLANHAFSYLHFRDLDRQGTPNIGTLMSTPYLRIVPMHLTIIFGAAIEVAGLGLLLFLGLKTISDILMHRVEHRIIGERASAEL